MKNDSIKFQATLANLPNTLSWVRSKIEPTALTSKEKNKVELALEEALINIIEHGGKVKKIEVTLHCKFEQPSQVLFEIFDNGPLFNPLIAPEINREAIPLEEQKIGGVGITLMKQCMDAVVYRREGAFNVLTLIKHFS